MTDADNHARCGHCGSKRVHYVSHRVPRDIWNEIPAHDEGFEVCAACGEKGLETSERFDT